MKTEQLMQDFMKSILVLSQDVGLKFDANRLKTVIELEVQTEAHDPTSQRLREQD